MLKNFIILFVLSLLLPLIIMEIFGYRAYDYFLEFVKTGYIYSFLCFLFGGFFGYIFNVHKLKNGDSHIGYIMPQIYFSLLFYFILLFCSMILASA